MSETTLSQSQDKPQTKTDGPLSYGPYPELSKQAILVGYFLGVIIAISIGYASLKLGFSIEGSELAAILGFGILRGILRRRSIVENNVTFENVLYMSLVVMSILPSKSLLHNVICHINAQTT